MPIKSMVETANAGVYDIIKKYIALVQSDGRAAHDIAIDIGKIAIQRKSIEQNLSNLLTAENCQKGMSLFLEHFDGRKLLSLAAEIGASDHVLSDIKKLFSVKHSAQWISTTGEDEIRKLTVEYEFVKISNILLNVTNNTKEASFGSWRDTLKFIGFSCEAIQAKRPSLNKLLYTLLMIANHDDILPDNLKQLLGELSVHNTEMRDILSDSVAVFREIYAPCQLSRQRKSGTSPSDGLDITLLLETYCQDREECTVKEMMERAEELTGSSNKQYSIIALYNKMVRVDADRFVSEEQVSFDVDRIDELLEEVIGSRFAPIREIATFALFPACGHNWNYYLLESYCYRFSRKYRLSVLNYNDKNAGMIAAINLPLTYNEMLIEAVATADIELAPETVGEYLYANGFTAKKKYS